MIDFIVETVNDIQECTMINLKSVKKEDDGSIHQWNISCQSDKMPEQTGVVRAKTRISGTIYKATGNENECEITHIVLVDPCGNIPTFMINANTSRIPKRVSYLNDLAKSL